MSLNLPSSSDAETARAAIASFAIHDGDRVHVSAVQPYSQKVVYTEGHVVRPGRMPYHDVAGRTHCPAQYGRAAGWHLECCYGRSKHGAASSQQASETPTSSTSSASEVWAALICCYAPLGA